MLELAQAIAAALNGMGVYLDGRRVGEMVDRRSIGNGTLVGRMGGGL